MRVLSLSVFTFLYLICLGHSYGVTQISLGGSFIDFNYNEELVAPQKSSEKSDSFYFSYDVKWGESSYLDFNGDFSFYTPSQYDGTDLNTSAPISATDEHAFHRHEGLYYQMITPSFFVYGGLGYRYWKRFLSYGTGYTEVYTWMYVPIGVYFSFDHPYRMGQFNYGVDFSIRPTMNGQLKVIFSDRVSSGQDSTLNLGPRTGYRLKVPMSYPAFGFGNISVTPWYEFSQIGQSNTVSNSTPGLGGSITEPSSTTQMLGVDFQLQFIF